MTDVNLYHVGETGLVEGVALGCLTVVLVTDFDRVTAERNQLQADLTARDERIDRFEQVLQKVATLRGTLEQHGIREEVDALLPTNLTTKRKAPWLDYAGHEIHEGDTMRHPDGMEFKVLYDSARRGVDCWRAYYLDETGLSLALQIGDKGMAQVVKP